MADDDVVDVEIVDDPWVEQPYERPANGQERDDWNAAVEDLPLTHFVVYRPNFVLKVKLPPWVDADAWLAEASMGWNDELVDAGEAWTEPGGYAWLEVTCDGSSQTIVDADGSSAHPGHQPHDQDDH